MNHNKTSLMDKCTRNKNIIFLFSCLSVHLVNILLFLLLHLRPLVYFNIFGTLLYVLFSYLNAKHKNLISVLAYFEIIVTAVISETLVGMGNFGYIYFIFGIVSSLNYLLSSSIPCKYIYQGIGAFFVAILVIVQHHGFCLFPEYSTYASDAASLVSSINIGVTLAIIIFISAMYLNELKHTKEELVYNSNHDVLTGLYNRRFFEFVIHRNQVEMNNEYSIAMLDVDDFKRFNDTYGHEAGDLVLETVSKCLNNMEDNHDFLAVRWGGEEFILYMPNTQISKAKHYVEKICNEIQNTTLTYGTSFLNVTVTAGISSGQSLNDYQEVICKADKNLYIGKSRGKNCIVTTAYTSDLDL